MTRVIGVGFIGAGNVLPGYLQVLDRLVPRGLATEGPICARRRETWPALLERRPGTRLVDSAEAVLTSDVDVVVIITPPDSHVALARRALEHGKHVIVEKPVAQSRADAEALFALAAERGLHLLAAPFVQLSPTFRELWTHLDDGEIGRVHCARGLYGNVGSDWARWYHAGGAGPLPELGIYNLKSLTALIGPVAEVLAAEAVALPEREIAGERLAEPDADVSHVILRHDGGALSSVVSSQAIQRYHRPALELYGTEGTANLLGDDWDPTGFELWRNDPGRWERYEPLDATWLWADGLREAVDALRQDRAPRCDPEHDLHLMEVVEAAASSAREGRAVEVASRFGRLDLRLEVTAARQHAHDHTRPFEEQYQPPPGD